MVIDFSIFKSIDFINTDNLIFLSIIFVVFLAALLVFLFILSKIVKIIKKAIIRMFNIDVKRPNFDRKEVISQSQSSREESSSGNMAPQKIIAIEHINKGHENNEKAEQDVVKTYKEKEEKSIKEHLDELKTVETEEKETLDSKMPSRSENQEEDGNKEIKIPVPEYPSTRPQPTGSVVSQSKNIVGDTPGTLSHKLAVSKADSSIFSGESEVSRTKLEHELRTSNKAYQAAKGTGLTMSQVERAKLVKDIPKVYGKNISKADLKGTIRQLNKKMVSTTNPSEHTKLRKEIKFFKKIGGV